MAKQLNLITSGQIIPTALHTEMQQSYLEYAMSVIVGRALPDVRDGLKPVHRRIIYAMHELGLTPDRPYRKCARVVGDVLGKYHPHGDQAVYDALVRMVQDFSSRYPLLAGHGNFGSVDDDPPAAMRYTETRLAGVAQAALLTEIGEATVDFTDNFDSSQQEPVVLPAQLPILLLNGSSGIAVGMATNIPPHNLGELVDGLIALIDRPHVSDRELLDFIPAPDFPTGGEIVYTHGIRDAYLTGRGSITLRGVVQTEEFQPARGRHRRTALIVSELPFQVNKATWIEKIADLVNNGKLEGIADLRDESDRDGIRVVIELKRDANPEKVLRELYRQTPLQINFGVILLALLDGQPRQLSLRQLLQEFLTFREETLTRRFSHELEQVNQRSHIVEGLLKGLTDLDRLINLLRHAPDGSTAKAQLQEQLELSDRQADAILGMPLRRLTGLEQQNLQTEFEELTQRRSQLEHLLRDRRELLKALKKDLRTLKRQFSDTRRTRIVGEIPPWPESRPAPASPTLPPSPAPELVLDLTVSTSPDSTLKSVSISPTDIPLPTSTPDVKAHPDSIIPSALVTPDPVLLNIPPDEPEPTLVQLTQRGYLQRSRMDTAVPIPMPEPAVGSESEAENLKDQVEQTWLTQTHHTLLFFTRLGKAYRQPIYTIPLREQTPQHQGIPVQHLLSSGSKIKPEAIAQVLELPPPTIGSDPDLGNLSQSLLLLSQKGRIKRVSTQEFVDCGNRGLTAFKLKEPDQLLDVQWIQPGQEVMIANQTGRLIRFTVTEADLPLMTRNHQGLPAMRLGQSEFLVGCLVLDQVQEVLLISQLGYYQRIPVTAIRRSLRGDLGTPIFRFTQRSDQLVALLPVQPAATLCLEFSDVEPLVCCAVDGLLPTLPGEISQSLTRAGQLLFPPDAHRPILQAKLSTKIRV